MTVALLVTETSTWLTISRLLSGAGLWFGALKTTTTRTGDG
ncbi:hypothetical protein APR04_001738 [Promicromonospora umidemergens]|nr:hypothetical protein [Promicromonospora umidemergens]